MNLFLVLNLNKDCRTVLSLNQKKIVKYDIKSALYWQHYIICEFYAIYLHKKA